MHSVDHNSWVNRGQLLPPLSLTPQISSQAAQLKVLPALSNTAARNTRHSPTRNGVRCREQGCWQPPWCRLILSESPELQDRPCMGCRDLTADTPVAHTEDWSALFAAYSVCLHTKPGLQSLSLLSNPGTAVSKLLEDRSRCQYHGHQFHCTCC